MFRRLRSPAFRPNPLGPLQMRTLNQANQYMASGQPAQAASLYTDLAGELEALNHPRRAANIHAQAAHAYADAGNEKAALVQARSALNLFIQNQMVRRTPIFYANISRKFAGKGMTAASDALAREFGSKVGSLPAAAAPSVSHGRLPTNCPKCGAPLHAEDANWVDDTTIECDFCGSLIRPE